MGAKKINPFVNDTGLKHDQTFIKSNQNIQISRVGRNESCNSIIHS